MKLLSFGVQSFFMIGICCPYLLYGMDNVLSRNNDNKRIAWNVVLTHGVQWFDYKMISSLAVNKDHDKILSQTAENRKQYFMRSDSRLKGIIDITWHRYGAIAGKIASGKSPNWPLTAGGLRGYNPSQVGNDLIMERRFLGGNSFPHYVAWDNFLGCLPHQPREFFDDQGTLCFHGCNEYREVTDYYLSPDGSQGKLQCVVKLKEYEFGLDVFLNFPVLLKAFLNSSRVHELPSLASQKGRLFTILRGNAKAYDIAGVIIPGNYRKYEPYFDERHYQSFDDLPKKLRKAIVTRYKEQHKKKKKK